jgi:hypothetical protein
VKDSRGSVIGGASEQRIAVADSGITVGGAWQEKVGISRAVNAVALPLSRDVRAEARRGNMIIGL